MKNILITICARGGSKGIPGKNIKMLNNRPLIYYSLKVAEQFAYKIGNTQIVLSTDDTEIKNVVHQLSNATDIEYSRPNRNPYFNMVEETGDGFYSLCKKGHFLTRQSAPKVYDMNASFYIFKNEFFSTGNKTVITDKTLVFEVPHICFDLDHPIDFEIMSFLLENSKLNFDFVE